MLSPGARVAHYVIEGHLGQGGMGEVFLAFDERLERRVALKFLPAQRLLDAVARGRMLREARAASALKHPGIVTIYEVGDDNGLTYIAMELVEGETLARLSGRRGPMPPAEAVALLRQIGDALVVAHEAGILHRDVKTANLMIDPRGQVKVLDFGLSKRMPASGTPSTPPPASRLADAAVPFGEAPTHTPTLTDCAEHGPIDPGGPTAAPASQPTPFLAARATPSSADPVTVIGARMGTPGRAALELMRGEEADRRSDVFSLGVVLYELLAGRQPFRSADLHDLIEQLAAETYQPASTHNPAVTARLDAVIARALRARREDRFDTVGDMLAAADAAIAPVARPSRRLRRVLVAVGTVGAIGGALALWALAGRSGAPTRAAVTAATPDAAPTGPFAPGRPAGPPRALTRLGGCAYAPTFADDETIVFDETLGGENHLWRVPLAGGAPQQLTRGALTEWRAMPGRRPGEVVYLVSNPASNTGEGAGVAALDLASERPEMLTAQQATSAVVIDGTLYYIRRDGSELRRVKNGVDESTLTFPTDVTAKQLAVTRAGRYVALLAANPGTPRVCIADLVDKKVECLKARRMSNGRPDYSADESAVYYAGFQGIGRVRADGSADELVVPDVYAQGGVAVSDDGRRLAYSDCFPRGALLDTGETPPRELAPPGRIGDVGAGPGGRVAFTTATATAFALMLREPGGQIREIASAADHRIVQPRFSRDGEQVVFVLAGVGLHMVTITAGHTLTPTALTSDPTDDDPAWLPDGRVAFTRRGGAAPGSYLVDVAGGAPVRIGSVPRKVVGTLADGTLLLLGIDVVQFFEWDPKTRREHKSRVSGAKVGRVVGVAMSPGGKWLAVQAGNMAERVYRYDLSQPEPEPELAFEANKGETLGGVSITDTGHVLAAPLAWTGEVYVIEAAAGTRF